MNFSPSSTQFGSQPGIFQPMQQYLNTPAKKAGFSGIVSLMIIGIILLIIWLVFLKKDGAYSKWSEWSECNKDCGGGQEIRKREYISASWGGTDLIDKDKIIEYRECNKDPCPINGSYSEWSEWSKCSKECNTGEQSRTRTYNLAQFGGIDISKNERLLKETQICNTNICPGDPVKVTEWADITDNNKIIIYKDNNNKININSIDPIEYEKKNFEVYKEQKRLFTKEGSNYKGKDTLEKILNDYKNKKEITESEIKLIIDNNGGEQIKKIKISNKDQFKFKSSIKSDILSTCTPEKGKERYQSRIITYYFPTGSNKHDKYFTLDLGFTESKWNEINNLKKEDKPILISSKNKTFSITCENEIEPKKYKMIETIKCNDVRFYEIKNLENLWKLENITGCSTIFSEKFITDIGGKTLEDYSYSNSGSADLENLIKNTWSKSEIIKEVEPRKKITQCYGDNYIFEVTPEMHKVSPKKNILQSGFVYTWKINSSKDDFEWVTSNGKIKLIFQYDGHLILRGNINKSNNKGDIIWKNNTFETSENWKGKWTLQMQFDGNLAIRNGRTQVWSTNTNNNPGAYAELSNNGSFIIKNKDNKNICYILRKIYGDRNIYFNDDSNWKYCKNNTSTDGILKDWYYYNNNGEKVEYIEGRVTLKTHNQPWGMTDKNTTDDERNKSGMIEPINIPQVNEPNKIVHVVLMNKLGERIYIEPQILLDIYNKGDKHNDDNVDLGCDGDEFNAVNAYNIDIDNFINKLFNSSVKLESGVFNNEKSNGVRNPYRFYKDYGAPHDNDKKLNIDGCTPFFNLYNNQRYIQFKNPLKADGFQEARTSNINLHENWLRDPRGEGASTYSVYWKVYYRTINDYVKYLNSPHSPNKTAFTNKSMFNNKCINDLEYFVNYKINQKNQSNFVNKLTNAYLEAIL